jgi:RNA polymerase sigma factor (TIGR02999 family)
LKLRCDVPLTILANLATTIISVLGESTPLKPPDNHLTPGLALLWETGLARLALRRLIFGGTVAAILLARAHAGLIPLVITVAIIRLASSLKVEHTSSSAMGEVTQILQRIEEGESHSSEELLSVVYDELRRLAASRLAREKPGQTLQPTALVHEAWLRLVISKAGKTEPDWSGRRHFFAAAAEAMRRILIERARRKRRVKHGCGLERVDFQGAVVAANLPSEQLIALDEALQRLDLVDPDAARLINLRFFAGMTQDQACETLGFSRRTADRLWAFGRAWLYRAIAADE